ncbi:hypothetical protein SAMN05216588_13427 [Pseudomonas flavescens]|uniref:Uncharacterized protein n=1 Tax=Phytopseudomonas flavescens TaxID=29435 RepID=A0A1G8QDP4_9GAMM|nr:hypothetical protein [Pseudomonas flavescens]SDJ02220.1 hypothetical protein SAMN05216588_13427 [Pseudomonas flavescens]
MTDKQPENHVPLINEPPILRDRVQELVPSMREADAAREPSGDTSEADDQRDAMQAPPYRMNTT